MSETPGVSRENAGRKSNRTVRPKAQRKRGRSAAGRPRRSAAESAPRGDARRKAILEALHTCVINKGYSKTTLADIAETAGLYSSHLLYYFDGKDAILQHYFQDVADKIASRMQGLRDYSAEQQIDKLADLFFAGEGIKKSELGFMFECFGVAVNDGILRKEKADMDSKCKECLRELFEKAPDRIMQASRDCAEIAYSMLIGLRSAVYFDEDLELGDAHRLFRNAMLHMAGIAPMTEPVKRKRSPK